MKDGRNVWFLRLYKMAEPEIKPVTEWPDWHANPDGGDPFTQDLNAPYDKRKFSLVGFCSDIIAGLVGITPAAGFVPVYVASLIGCLTATCCYYAVKYKHLLSVDDGLGIFVLHGVGGYVDNLLAGIFADNFVPALDGVSGSSYTGRWWSRNFRQLGRQFAGATTAAAWPFVISRILLFIIHKIPGLHLRASEDSEIRGLDIKYLEDVDEERFYMNGCILHGCLPTAEVLWVVEGSHAGYGTG
ncbi:ammonium transporter family-domain-containing protein [Pseudoneurospora amorphoporcata]|uniref:Ammonium transporter family-domain-containing protein n=1 Tax=Pseudoneurospora amorphoporcata TaxID=241081 RepID=A0AAN6NRP8_9PEZI|nr:ammonium transporter family-domain-containing protein [Pseudoneurospora amorphoporcata]